MKSPIILIGFQEQDNLGLGYIGSTLLVNGFQVKFIDYRQDKESILKIIQRNNPLIIGFSIIFQYHIYDFRDILSFLRENGINAHFSAGGHYPSLKYKELFEIVGNLDSIVLFEGEHTFLKLVRAIYNKTDWKRIEGIAFKENNNVFANNLCPLEPDLDNFPIPARPSLKEYALGKNYATLIAGRGCYYNCGFCSIQQFYKQPKGKVKRIRRPELVVEEMKYLYENKGCQIFMFQDDDFPVNQKKEKNWIFDFCKELRLQKLKNKIIWKINCRPDEIEKDNFSLMKEHGLFVVYLGVENGTDAGLKIMNKHANREQNIQAVETLKKLDIYFDFGFMLFHPWSTTESVSENIDFLEIIIGDGYSPVTFCKLLPYAETAIENQLKKENRIFGITGFEDYNFLDDGVDKIFNFSTFLFSEWINSHNGILNTSRWANYHSLVMEKFYPNIINTSIIKNNIKTITAESNNYFFEKMNQLISSFREITNEQLNITQFEIQKNHYIFQGKLEQQIQLMEQELESNLINL